jgi:hypothetical protein
MVIQGFRAAVGLARSAITCKVSGMGQAVRAYVEGRNVVNLERERRITLLTVPPALPPGAEVYDLRADGSVLQMRIQQSMRIDTVPAGDTYQGAPRGALPAVNEGTRPAQTMEQ